MAESNWDFECPQFFDFCAGVEDELQEQASYGNKLPTVTRDLDFGAFGPGFEEGTSEEARLGGDSPITSNEEFKFKSKFLFPKKNGHTPWNNKLSTPREKSPFVNTMCRTNTTDSEKLYARMKRLSKSDGAINFVPTNLNTLAKQVRYCPSHKKRSISESDIRPKRKFPVTPVCLKRTLARVKSKKAKTTEELELEKIAELQKQTLKHIRSNEMAMKRLNLRQKPIPVPKMIPKMKIKDTQKGYERVVEKNHFARIMGTRPKISVKEHLNPTEKLKVASNMRPKSSSNASRYLQPTTSSRHHAVFSAGDENEVFRKELSVKKLGENSGVFSTNQAQKPVRKPFTLYNKPRNFEFVLPSRATANSSNMKENEQGSKLLAKYYEAHSGIYFTSSQAKKPSSVYNRTRESVFTYPSRSNSNASRTKENEHGTKDE